MILSRSEPLVNLWALALVSSCGGGVRSGARGKIWRARSPAVTHWTCRAQTHRSATDRPAPGARGGFLLGAVSDSHCSQMGGLAQWRLTDPENRHYLQSPYYFMCCSLYDATEDRPVPVAPSTALAGTLVSSLHRLKDVDNSGKCYCSQPRAALHWGG